MDKFGFVGETTEYKLEDLFNLEMGKTPSRNNDEYWSENEYKWISIADLTKTGKYVSDTKEYLSERGITESGISVIPANTVVMSFKLSIGKTAITTEDMYSNEAIMAFHDKHVVKLIPDYIYYLLLSQNWNEGANKAVMGLTQNKATLSKRKVSIHNIEHQRQIVNHLDKLQNVISMRQQQLEELDTLIKARFVEMFGSPVSNPKKFSTMQMNEVAPTVNYVGNFEDKVWLLNLDMVESQSGRILDYVVVDINEVGNSTCSFDTTNVLYSKLRPYLNKVVIPDRCGFATSELVPLQPVQQLINREYLAYMLRSDDFVSMITEKVAGAKMPRVSMEDFRRFEVPIPPLELQKEFASFVTQIDKLRFDIQKSLNEMQTLFDSLMQKYFG